MIISLNGRALVGEIQFILTPIIQGKKLYHKLYEISRMQTLKSLATDVICLDEKQVLNLSEIVQDLSQNRELSSYKHLKMTQIVTYKTGHF